jgi:hypothetical protein
MGQCELTPEIAEMYMEKLRSLVDSVRARDCSVRDRVSARAWLWTGRYARMCVNQLFEAKRRLGSLAQRRPAALLPRRQRAPPTRGHPTQQR